MNRKQVLAFDPGIGNTGWALVQRSPHSKFIVNEAGIIKTKTTQPIGERLATIHQHVTDLVRNNPPDLLAMEAVFFNKNVTSCISTGQVIAMIEFAAYQSSIDTLTIRPQLVKAAVTGATNATKKQVLKYVNRLTKAEIKNPHIADAVACGIAALLRIHSAEWIRKTKAIGTQGKP